MTDYQTAQPVASGITMADCTCAFCGVGFSTRATYLKRGGGVYCSTPCRNKGIGRNVRLRNVDRVVIPNQPTPEKIQRRLKAFPSNIFDVSPEREVLFWSKVDKSSDPTGCWVWNGSLSKTGYASTSIRQRPALGHRISAYLHGIIAPAGHVIDHICRNRACVNPAHLRVATFKQNIHENSEAEAKKNLKKTHCLKGHPFSGENLMVTAYGRRCRICDANWGAAARKAKKENLNKENGS